MYKQNIPHIINNTTKHSVLLTTSQATALVVVGGARDINDATFVGNGRCLNHVVSQQICQQERPCDRLTILYFMQKLPTK